MNGFCSVFKLFERRAEEERAVLQVSQAKSRVVIQFAASARKRCHEPRDRSNIVGQQIALWTCGNGFRNVLCHLTTPKTHTVEATATEARALLHKARRGQDASRQCGLEAEWRLTLPWGVQGMCVSAR
jgi:hypothetical protein